MFDLDDCFPHSSNKCPKCHVCSLSGPWVHVDSTSSCVWLSRLFTTLVDQVSKLVHPRFLVPAVVLFTSMFAASKVFTMPIVQPVSWSAHLQSMLVSLCQLLWLSMSNIGQGCLECSFGSATLWRHQNHSHTDKFATFEWPPFSWLHSNDSLQAAIMPSMLTDYGVDWDQLACLVRALNWGPLQAYYILPHSKWLRSTPNGLQSTPQPLHKMIHITHYTDLLWLRLSCPNPLLVFALK